MEQFANNCKTTVASAYTAGDGHIHVASTAAPFPQVGDFRISVFDSVTKALKVILKVTAVASGTEFTVTAEGTDADAAAGDLVYGTIVTAGVMRNIGRVLLAEKTASNSASLDFTDSITSAYDEYEIEFVGLVPATNNQELKMFYSTDGGANYATSNYKGVYHSVVAGAHTYGATATTYGGLPGVIQNDANWGISGFLKFFNLGAALVPLYTGQFVVYDTSNNIELVSFSGAFATVTPINAIKFLFASGNITKGTIRIYGLAK